MMKAETKKYLYILKNHSRKRDNICPDHLFFFIKKLVVLITFFSSFLFLFVSFSPRLYFKRLVREIYFMHN